MTCRADEAIQLVLFLAECLDDAQRRHDFVDDAERVALQLLDLARTLAQTRAVDAREHEQRRRDGDGDDGELPV